MNSILRWETQKMLPPSVPGLTAASLILGPDLLYLRYSVPSRKGRSFQTDTLKMAGTLMNTIQPIDLLTYVGVKGALV